MPLVNGKVELKLKWTKYCVLHAAGNEDRNDNVNDNNGNKFFFTIKNTRFHVPVVTLSAKDNQKLSKLLAKDLKDQFIEMNIKQLVTLQIRQMNIHTSSNQNLLELIDYFINSIE